AAAPAAATATTATTTTTPTSIPDVTVPKGFPTSVVPGSVGNATCEAAYSKSINILITCGWNPDGTTNVAVVGASICSNLPVIESLPIVCNNVASTKQYVDDFKTVIPACKYLNQVGSLPDTVVETAASSAAQSPNVASSNVGAIVGATLAGVALLSVIVASVYFLRRKKNAGKEEDEMVQQHSDRSDRSETMSISAAQQQQHPSSWQGSNRNTNSGGGGGGGGSGGTGSGGSQSDAVSSRASASTPLLRLDSIVSVLPQKTAASKSSSEHESSSNQSMFSFLSGGAVAAVANVGRFHPARDGDEKKGWSKGNNKAQGLFGSMDSSYKEVEPETWSVAQTVLWVKELGYAVEIQKAFQDASVDGAFLKVMGRSQEACKESLKNDLGVENVRSRVLLADAILSLFEVETSGFEPPGYSEL
ncbi:hypothetical protein HDU80_011584, partial [Chytriomyces hyalinus]